MSRRFVEVFADGDNVDEVFLIADKHLRVNRNGAPYLLLDLLDRTGTISGRMWNVSDDQHTSFEAGDYLLIHGKVQLFQGSLQLIVNNFDKVDPAQVDPADFLPTTKHNIGTLLEKLKGFLRKITNHHLRALVDCYLIDDQFMKGFTRAPAGIKVHHAYLGGLLEHVVMMLDISEKILPLYPNVNKDLVQVGIFLHDSGKIRELTYQHMFSYSDEGQLVGHLAIGLEFLSEKIKLAAKQTGEAFPDELYMHLRHLIVSHHGESQFGSPKIPMTLEAIALHIIDMFDSRLCIAMKEIDDDRKGSSHWTPFNVALQRRLYKGKSE
ncbi:MAG: OB-fold nucleic acid binding domain-containing protein [Zavarzinella sp.]